MGSLDSCNKILLHQPHYSKVIWFYFEFHTWCMFYFQRLYPHIQNPWKRNICQSHWRMGQRLFLFCQYILKIVWCSVIDNYKLKIGFKCLPVDEKQVPTNGDSVCDIQSSFWNWTIVKILKIFAKKKNNNN